MDGVAVRELGAVVTILSIEAQVLVILPVDVAALGWSATRRVIRRRQGQGSRLLVSC